MLDKTRAEVIKELQTKLKPMQPQPILLTVKERKANNVR